MMGESNKTLRGTQAPGDHTVVIPSRISDVEDVTWMSRGRTLTFAHEKDFVLEFVTSPSASGQTTFDSKPNGKVVIPLKNVSVHTVCKYTIKSGGQVHDPIVIIDPN